MSRELAVKIEALELAKHAHVDYELPVSAGQDSGWLTITPDTNFEGMIAYWMTFGDVTTRIWRIRSLHRGYSLGDKTLGDDEIRLGMAGWFYITDLEPFRFRAGNLSVADATLYCTMWYLNVTTKKQMDRIRIAVWQYLNPGMLEVALKYGWIQALNDISPSELEECLKVGRK